jgi:hypothetical protein
MVTQIKKKNLFKFFKSEEFNEARVKLCALFIILSYANELHEDVDRLLQGYEGLWIGELKHAGKEATRALERYDKEYRMHILDNGEDLCDATIDVTKPLDIQIEQSKFFLQEGSKAIRQVLDEQIENRVKDPKALERESQADFEICGQEERKQALFVAKKMAKNRFDELGVKNEEDLLKGVEVGFNIAVNWINRLYLEA